MDASGSAYVTGQTESTNFPAGRRSGVSDAFVAKLAPDGRSVEWSTYLGGAVDEQGNGIAVDRRRRGRRRLDDVGRLPHARADPGFAERGITDAFLTKLSPAGALVWSTYSATAAPTGPRGRRGPGRRRLRSPATLDPPTNPCADNAGSTMRSS